MSGISELIKEKIAAERILTDEPMCRHTSFHIGGKADILVLPETTEDIKYVMKLCRENGIKCHVIGNGTNLLVSDNGIRGVVIKTSALHRGISLCDGLVTASAGILLSSLARYALEHCLGGLEFAEGIPGTLGGAVVMNAGAYDGEIKNVFYNADILTEDDNVVTLDNTDMCFGYRTSTVQRNGGVVLSAVLQLTAGEQENIQDKMDEFKRKRKERQPLELHSAGSVFKRPPGYFAGKLIMDSGLAGYSIGGAQVSEKHCGFIVNKGGAVADDVIRLIAHIQNVVMDKFGIKLETEIKFMGE